MRFFEISSGLRVPVSGEEQGVMDKVLDARKLRRSALDDREQEVARNMVNRGLLRRRKDDDGTYFVANSDADLWRW